MPDASAARSSEQPAPERLSDAEAEALARAAEPTSLTVWRLAAPAMTPESFLADPYPTLFAKSSPWMRLTVHASLIFFVSTVFFIGQSEGWWADYSMTLHSLALVLGMVLTDAMFFQDRHASPRQVTVQWNEEGLSWSEGLEIGLVRWEDFLERRLEPVDPGQPQGVQRVLVRESLGRWLFWEGPQELIGGVLKSWDDAKARGMDDLG